MELQDMFYITEENWYKLQAWAKLAYDKDKNERCRNIKTREYRN